MNSSQPKSDDYYFGVAKKLAETKSTCLKIKNAAVIVKNNKIIGRGYNRCSPEGFNHGKKVKKCLRMNLPTGVGYELCKGVHTEVNALIDAGAKNCKGATLYLYGHDHLCWQCESHVRLAGINDIRVKDGAAGKYYASFNQKRNFRKN